MKYLLDGFRHVGNDYKELKTLISEMTEKTKTVKVRGGDIIFLSLCQIPKYQQPGKVTFFVFTEEFVSEFLSTGRQFQIATISIENIGEELLEELKNTTGLIALIGNDKYLISSITMPTLCRWVSVTGFQTVNRNNFIRDLHLADAMFAKNEKLHFIYREDKNENEKEVKKIFGTFGSKFSYEPLSTIIDLIDRAMDGRYGKGEVKEWSVSQELTEVHIEFPESTNNGVTPGLYFCTSDVGSSSYIIRRTARKGSAFVVTDERSIRHTEKATAEYLFSLVDSLMEKEDVFISALSELTGAILDYGRVNTKTDDGSAVNYQVMKEVLTETTHKLFATVLPMKWQKKVVECMMDDINSSEEFSQLNVALMFLMVPDKLHELDDFTVTDVRKACIKAPGVIKKITPYKNAFISA